MKKKLTVLTLVIALVFTMTMPSFAAVRGLNYYANTDGISYCALGDSISAGCKNLEFMSGEIDGTDDPEFYEFNQLEGEHYVELMKGEIPAFMSGNKIMDPYAVSFSCVARIAEKINASKTNSCNGAYVGLRSKDVCQILGLAKEDKNDNWGQLVRGLAPALFSNNNKVLYQQGIKKADVITVELGENDMSALLLNQYEEVFGLIGDVIKTAAAKLPEAAALAKAFSQDAKVLISDLKNNKENSEAFASVLQDIKAAKELGISFSDVANRGLKFYRDNLTESEKYFDMLMNYIDKNKKPGAIVVVGSLINPLETMDLSYLDDELGSLAPYMSDILSIFITPYIAAMNTHMYQKQTKSVYNIFVGKTQKVRRYYMADISHVELNPAPELDAEGNVMTYYTCHPNAVGQQQIADAFLEKIYLGQAEKGDVTASVKSTDTKAKNDAVKNEINYNKLKKLVDKVKSLFANFKLGDLFK